MDIKEIARETIIALRLVRDKDVVIDKVTPAWSGSPEIRVSSDPTKPEDETQFGPVSETTVLWIHCLAIDRQESWDIARKAAHAVYEKFEELERQRGSGIFCITYAERNTVQLDGNLAFHSFVNFRILHSPTL